MLDHPEDSPALQQLNKWLDSIRAQSKDPHRLTLLFDPSDAFEAGVALAMIRSLRSRWGEKALFLSLLALHQPKEGHDREAAADLRSFLTVLRDRRLLRRLTGEETDGADALWLLAFPTSFASGPDALPLLELSAARVLQILSRPDRLPDCGLHIRSLPGRSPGKRWTRMRFLFSRFFGLWSGLLQISCRRPVHGSYPIAAPNGIRYQKTR